MAKIRIQIRNLWLYWVTYHAGDLIKAMCGAIDYKRALQNPRRHPEHSEGFRCKGHNPIHEILRQAQNEPSLWVLQSPLQE